MIEKIDTCIGELHFGECYLIAGRPGMGKTSLAGSIVRDAIKKFNVRTHYYISDNEMSFVTEYFKQKLLDFSALTLNNSEDFSSDKIAPDSLIVLDYWQLLNKAVNLSVLKQRVFEKNACLIILSMLDRSFDVKESLPLTLEKASLDFESIFEKCFIIYRESYYKDYSNKMIAYIFEKNQENILQHKLLWLSEVRFFIKYTNEDYEILKSKNNFDSNDLSKKIFEYIDSNIISVIPSPKKTKDEFIKKITEADTRNDKYAFSNYLEGLIAKKGKKNYEVYNAAMLDRKYFSKIITGSIHPSKIKVLCLAVGLELSIEEAEELLLYSGYAFSPIDNVDLVFKYFIENKDYDVIKIDILLYKCGFPTISKDL